MSILSLIKKYISLKIDQLETDNRRDENLNKFITSLTDFILSDKINRILDIFDIAKLKGTIDKEKGFKPTESDIENIGKEIAENMEQRPIPYLMEMLNIEICNTIEENCKEIHQYVDGEGFYIPLLLNIWKKLETKSSNIIMGRLLTLIQNERMKNNSSK